MTAYNDSIVGLDNDGDTLAVGHNNLNAVPDLPKETRQQVAALYWNDLAFNFLNGATVWSDVGIMGAVVSMFPNVRRLYIQQNGMHGDEDDDFSPYFLVLARCLRDTCQFLEELEIFSSIGPCNQTMCICGGPGDQAMFVDYHGYQQFSSEIQELPRLATLSFREARKFFLCDPEAQKFLCDPKIQMFVCDPEAQQFLCEILELPNLKELSFQATNLVFFPDNKLETLSCRNLPHESFTGNFTALRSFRGYGTTDSAVRCLLEHAPELTDLNISAGPDQDEQDELDCLAGDCFTGTLPVNLVRVTLEDYHGLELRNLLPLVAFGNLQRLNLDDSCLITAGITAAELHQIYRLPIKLNPLPQ